MNNVLKAIKPTLKNRVFAWEDTIPIHKHDCIECEFLGTYPDHRHYYDLYYCDQAGIPTFIARWGDESKYYSGMSSVPQNNALSVAFARKIMKDYR